MKLTRTLACLGASLVAAGGLALGAAAVPTTETSSGGGVAMPNCHNLIQGVVVDQLGHKVDDVDVQAFNAQDDEPDASALTYASPDNEIRHGYFWLCVGRGTFTLDMSKTGYRSRTGIEAGYVAHGAVRSLGELTLKMKKKDTTTTLKLAGTTSEDKRATAKITVEANGLTPGGDVEVVVTGKPGTNKKQTVLDKTYGLDDGTVSVKLPKLEAPPLPKCTGKGKKRQCTDPPKYYTWTVTVDYLGDPVTDTSDDSDTIRSYPEGKDPADK